MNICDLYHTPDFQCSVTCGNGRKQRSVTCSAGTNKCDPRTRPQSHISCNAGSCPQWRVTEWSQVSKWERNLKSPLNYITREKTRIVSLIVRIKINVTCFLFVRVYGLILNFSPCQHHHSGDSWGSKTTHSFVEGSNFICWTFIINPLSCGHLIIQIRRCDQGSHHLQLDTVLGLANVTVVISLLFL